MPTPMLLQDIAPRGSSLDLATVIELPCGTSFKYHAFSDILSDDVSPPIIGLGIDSWGVIAACVNQVPTTYTVLISILHPVTLVALTDGIPVAVGLDGTGGVVSYFSFGNDTANNNPRLGLTCFSLVTRNNSATDTNDVDFVVWGFSTFSRGFGNE